MASLFKTMTPETLTLEDALKLLSLPREVGTVEETNAETGEVSQAVIAANNGRYGPYLTKTGADGKSETRSLGSEDEIFTVDLEKAKELFSQPKYGRGPRPRCRQTAAARTGPGSGDRQGRDHQGWLLRRIYHRWRDESHAAQAVHPGIDRPCRGLPSARREAGRPARPSAGPAARRRPSRRPNRPRPRRPQTRKTTTKKKSTAAKTKAE